MLFEALLAAVIVGVWISNGEESPSQRRYRKARIRKNRKFSRWYD